MDSRAMKMAQARRAAKFTDRAAVAPGATVPGMKRGGETKEMMKKEVAFMKKKGAPKSMVRHEEEEAGMKKGVKKFRRGRMVGVLPSVSRGTAYKTVWGSVPQAGMNVPYDARLMSGQPNYNYKDPRTGKDFYNLYSNLVPGVRINPEQLQTSEGESSRGEPLLRKGGKVKKRMAGGGSTGGSFRRAADGIASKGKTKGKMVKMRYGGKC